MRPDTVSCGTYDRLWIRPAHNVALGRCFHSDRTRESYASPPICRPSVSPARSCCESLHAMRKSNPSFSCRTKNLSPRSGCRHWEVTAGTSSHSQLLPKPRGLRTHRLSGYPATRMAEGRWRPPGTSSVFTRCLTKLHAPRTPMMLESHWPIVTALQPSHARPGLLGLMSL